MPHQRPNARHLVALASALVATTIVSGGPSAQGYSPQGIPDDDRTIIHILNRLGYGPRPGDIERVRETGVEAYIEEQLHPQRIDDTALKLRLSALNTLGLSTNAILEQYHLPAERARREARSQAAAGSDQNPTAAGQPSGRGPQPGSRAGVLGRGPQPGRRAGVLGRGPQPGSRAGVSGPIDPNAPGPERPRPELPEEVRRERVVLQELVEQKLLRGVYSERQLEEVLVDFWFNHFNVSAQKGRLILPFLTSYERDIIRPHVLGNFRDLLGAVAESPAMLIYLDNWLSSDPGAPEAYRAKLKTPLEFVVSTLRALDVDIQQAAPLARLLNEMGMPLYACQPPTGYPDRADTWVNSGALLARMNAAVDLVGGRMRGIRVDLGSATTFDESDLHALLTKMVQNEASPTTRETLERSAAGPDQFAVLALGSPEFQRR